MPPYNRYQEEINRWRERQEWVSIPPRENARIINQPADVPWEVVETEPVPDPDVGFYQAARTIGLSPVEREVTVEFDDSSRRVQERSVSRPRGYWKLRNGKFIAMSEMDDGHLNNCIRLCERNQQARGRRADPLAPGVYGELINERRRRLERLQEHGRQIWIENQRTMNGQQASSIGQESNLGSVSGMNLDLMPHSKPEPIGLPEGAPKRRIKT